MLARREQRRTPDSVLEPEKSADVESPVQSLLTLQRFPGLPNSRHAASATGPSKKVRRENLPPSNLAYIHDGHGALLGDQRELAVVNDAEHWQSV